MPLSGYKLAASAGTALLNWGAAKLEPFKSASMAESLQVAPAVGFYGRAFNLFCLLPQSALSRALIDVKVLN